MKRLNKEELRMFDNSEVWCQFTRRADGRTYFGDDSYTFPLCTLGGTIGGRQWLYSGDTIVHTEPTEKGAVMYIYRLTGRKCLVLD